MEDYKNTNCIFLYAIYKQALTLVPNVSGLNYMKIHSSSALRTHILEIRNDFWTIRLGQDSIHCIISFNIVTLSQYGIEKQKPVYHRF